MGRAKKKARVDKSPPPPPDSEPEEEEEFQVEYIKKVKVSQDGIWLYLVKWFGYDDPSDDTWEPDDHISRNCQRLLASFWKEIGDDNKDYHPGQMFEPSPEWIEIEKNRFARDEKKKRKPRVISQPDLKKEKEELKATQGKKGKAAGTRRASRSTTVKAEDETPPAPKRGRKTRTATVLTSDIPEPASSIVQTTEPTLISSDSGSDSDRPLIQGKRKRTTAKKRPEEKSQSVTSENSIENPSLSMGDPALLFVEEEKAVQDKPGQPSEQVVSPSSTATVAPLATRPAPLPPVPPVIPQEAPTRASLPSRGSSATKPTPPPVPPAIPREAPIRASLPSRGSSATKLTPPSAGPAPARTSLPYEGPSLTKPTSPPTQAQAPLSLVNKPTPPPPPTQKLSERASAPSSGPSAAKSLPLPQVNKKPTLPRLMTQSGHPGPRSAPRSASSSILSASSPIPTPANLKGKTTTAAPLLPSRPSIITPPLPSRHIITTPLLPAKPPPGSSSTAGGGNAGGISTKQRLAQTALQMTTVNTKVSEASHPLPPQKSSSLPGINFKKTKAMPVTASPTITAEDMAPKNVPLYSPQNTLPPPSAARPSRADFNSPQNSPRSPLTATASTSAAAATSSAKPPSLPRPPSRSISANNDEMRIGPSLSRKSQLKVQTNTFSPDTRSSATPTVSPVVGKTLLPPSSKAPAVPAATQPPLSGDDDMEMASASPVSLSLGAAGQPSDGVEVASLMEVDLPPAVSASSSSSSKARRMDEAEKFLQSIPLSQLFAQPRVESPIVSPTVAVIPILTSSLQLSRKPNKNRALWTGEIIFQTLGVKDGQTLCKEGLLMPLGQHLALGQMPLRVAMSYNESKLSIRSLYGVNSLNDILGACNPVQEWGWLGSEEEGEMSKLKNVADFLVAKRLFGSIPILIEGNVVGLLLLYPSTLPHDRLPRTTLNDSPSEITLNVALYSWNLPADARSREKSRKHYLDRLDFSLDRRDHKLPPGTYEVFGEPGISVKQTRGFKTMMKHAVRMLELPEALHSYLSSGGDRAFALWPPMDSDAFRESKIPGSEMQMLQAILKEYPMTVDRGFVGSEFDSSLRIIFVHVNSFGARLGQKGNIREMPGLARYRASNDVRFFVYGSSDVVNPHFSDVMEEIWHIGGIVTFTASALLQNPLGVYHRIHQIEDHDIWACYISPAVIGMVVSTAYHDKHDLVQKRIACTALEHGSNSTEDFSVDVDDDDSGIGLSEPVRCTCDGFEFEWLLQAISDELVSIVGAPPFPVSDVHASGNGALHRGIRRDAKPHSKDEWYKMSDDLLTPVQSTSLSSSLPLLEAQYNDPFTSWTLALFDNDFRTRSETLDYCVKEFQRICGSLAQKDWEEVTRKEVMMELDRLQLSRGFREDLRRFVIVTEKEDSFLGSNKGGFEWVTAEDFRFNDDSDSMDPFSTL